MESDDDLAVVSPESVGISSRAVLSFIDSARDKAINLHSFLLLRHGRVAAEGYYAPFSAGRRHDVMSVTKGFVSAAVGLAICEGRFSLDDRIAELLPVTGRRKSHAFTRTLTVRNLLSMSSVHDGSPIPRGTDWLAEYLEAAPDHPPSTLFSYDSGASYVLCAVLQGRTGMSLHRYLKEKLLDRIGIGEIQWDTCPMGINIGGYGIRCTTRDMARFGQLYLGRGNWNGDRVLPEDWVRASTSKQTDCSNADFLLDGAAGYGYHFWRCRNDSYCSFGSGGQFILVVPRKDAVFVTTANTRMHKNAHQSILDSFWEQLYPGIADGLLPDDERWHGVMRTRLADLKLTLPKDAGIPEVLGGIRGVRIALRSNFLRYTAFVVDADQAGHSVTFYEGDAARTVRFGYNRWIVVREPFLEREAAAAGVWVDEKTLVVHLQLLDALELFVVTIAFAGEGAAAVQIRAAGTCPGAERYACSLSSRSPTRGPAAP